MNGRVVPLQSGAHRELEELLPWYASGALGPEQCERVEQHLAGCAQCQTDLAFEQRLRSRMQALPPPGADVERGLARLRRRIDDSSRQRSAARPTSARLFGWRDAPAWLRWTLVAQFAVIAAFGVFALRPPHEYHALGDMTAPPHVDAPTANVVVRFRPLASERDMRAALVASEARVVNGPTATGAWVVAVPAAHLNSAVEQLRAHAAVALAESLEARTSP